MGVVELLEGSLEWRGVGVIFDSPQELLVLNHGDGLLFEIVVVSGCFINNSFDNDQDIV